MMRLVVTNGTAKDINDAGDVRGKTGGEAEFEGGSHAWFAGYRGDMAFAALIVGGGSSEYAVRMVKMMLQELPADYLPDRGSGLRTPATAAGCRSSGRRDRSSADTCPAAGPWT